MKTINGILILEKEHDYDKKDIIWEHDDSIRLYNLGVIHHNNNHTFPQFYEYVKSWDTHSCGEYYPIDKNEAIMKIKGYINRLTNEAKELDELIAKL